MSVRLSASNNSAATARIFMKFYISLFSENCRENTSFITISQEWRVLYMKTTRHFWSYLAKFLLKWEMFQTKVVEENKTHLLWSVNFFFKENGAVYEIMWINIAEPDRPQMTIWRTRIACRIPKATNTHTHTQYMILVAFALQQWLRERVSMSRYTHIACLVSSCPQRQFCKYQRILAGAQRIDRLAR